MSDLHRILHHFSAWWCILWNTLTTTSLLVCFVKKKSKNIVSFGKNEEEWHEKSLISYLSGESAAPWMVAILALKVTLDSVVWGYLAWTLILEKLQYPNDCAGKLHRASRCNERKTVGRRLKPFWNHVPHFSLFVFDRQPGISHLLPQTSSPCWGRGNGCSWNSSGK